MCTLLDVRYLYNYQFLLCVLDIKNAFIQISFKFSNFLFAFSLSPNNILLNFLSSLALFLNFSLLEFCLCVGRLGRHVCEVSSRCSKQCFFFFFSWFWASEALFFYFQWHCFSLYKEKFGLPWRRRHLSMYGLYLNLFLNIFFWHFIYLFYLGD